MMISEIIIQLKKHIAMGKYVSYQGIRYIPICLVYWFDRVQNQWNYSVELMDLTHKNSTIRVNVEKIAFKPDNENYEEMGVAQIKERDLY